MNRICCHGTSGECQRENERFTVVLVVGGRGWMEYGTEDELSRIPVVRGSELFLPHGLKTYRYVPVEELEILECYPPAEWKRLYKMERQTDTCQSAF